MEKVLDSTVGFVELFGTNRLVAKKIARKFYVDEDLWEQVESIFASQNIDISDAMDAPEQSFEMEKLINHIRFVLCCWVLLPRIDRPVDGKQSALIANQRWIRRGIAKPTARPMQK